jgi:hypothetical protein
MLPSAVTPANLHLFALRRKSSIRSIPIMYLPFSVHTSKFRMLQALFFDTLTDTPGVGSTHHQTLPKLEPATTNKFDQRTLIRIAVTRFAVNGSEGNSSAKPFAVHRSTSPRPAPTGSGSPVTPQLLYQQHLQKTGGGALRNPCETIPLPHLPPSGHNAARGPL